MPRLLGLAVGAWFAGVAVLAQGPGLFAKQAEPVTSGRTSLRSGGRVAVSTANGSSAFPATLLVTRDGGRLERSFEFGLNAEVLWSPDGSRFAVTGSEGGANGQYRTAVVTIAGDRLGWFDVTPMVERAFGHPVKCGYPDAPNVAAIVWQSNVQLVVAAQILNHSNCDSFGTFASYAVDIVARRVGQRFDQPESKRRWRQSLGIELLAAPDECVRTPRSCFVPTNHPKKDR